jgi:SAM-dependent methyltransferase
MPNCTMQLRSHSSSLDTAPQRTNLARMGGISVCGRGTIFGPSRPKSEGREWQRRLAFFFAALALSLVVTEIEVGRVSSRSARSRSGVRRPGVHSVPRSPAVSLRSTLRQYLRAVGGAPFVYPIVNTPLVRKVLSALPGSRALYGSKWDRKHPFDRVHGTDTSGFLYGDDILTGHPAEEHGSPYAGVQPSVLRRALATLPGIDGSTFIDLGCGKGRPMLIASELPFRDIVGVELSPALAEAARRNAVAMARRWPNRTPIRVEIADATAYSLPPGDVVLFIYNSFDRELMLKVVENVEAALAADQQRSVFVVFCNPVSGDCFDASPVLTRRFAQTLAYTPEERDYAEDAEDAVIIWQGGQAAPPTSRADARIVITKERWRAELQA